MRISDALGLPVAVFYRSDADPDTLERLRHVRQGHILTLVRAYLSGVDSEAVRHLVVAVPAPADGEVR